MKSTEAGRQVLELLRELQRSNGAIGKLYGADLNLGDSHTIIELTQNPHATTVELAEIVGLDQSSISRLLTKLVQKKILVKKKLHGRSGHFLTADGKKILTKINKSADRINATRLKNISAAEQEWFFEVFDKLCNLVGASPSARQPHEHIFRSIQRRVARVIGMVKGLVAESVLATSHWHIMSELMRFSDPIDLDRIIDRLTIERPVLVAALHALRLKGLIKSDASGLDSRKTLYSITPEGQLYLRKALYILENRLDEALHELGEKSSGRFVRLLANFIEYAPADEAISSLKDYRFATVTARGDRDEIRAAYVSWVVATKKTHEVPSRLFGQEELTFALYSEKGKLVACAQAEPREEGIVLSAIASSPDLSSDVCRLFLSRCRGQLPKQAM